MTFEQLEYARKTVGEDPVAQHLGLTVAKLERARAVVTLTPEDKHLNALGRVHGTTIYALVDQALAVASNTMEGSALVLECKINFLDAAQPGVWLSAEARPVKLGRKICVWEVAARDRNSRLVATAQALTFHRQEKKED